MLNQNESNSLLSKQLDNKVEEYQIHGNYITNNDMNCENAEVIKDLLEDNNKYCLIVAPTGTGKTSRVLSIVKELKLEFVTVSPLVALTEQTAKNIEIPGISKEEAHQMGMSLNTFVEEMGKSCAAVFDKLKYIIENSDIENKILVIDEAHHLITSSGYRSKSLKYLEENLMKFRKVVFLTGTPEVLYMHSLLKNARMVKFSFELPIPICKYHYRIIPYENMGFHRLLNHIAKNPVLGKTIVFINNLNELIEVKSYLVEMGIDKNSIFIAHSNSKQNEYFKYLVNNERIHDDIKYFLTTSVISDGVNIKNEDIDSFYLFGLNDLTLLRQIIKRPRNKVGNIYDFVSSKSCESIPEIKKIYNEKYCSVEIIIKMVRKNMKTNPYFASFLDIECKIPGIYFNEKNVPYLYESEIIRIAFEEFYEATLQNPSIRKELILDLECWTDNDIIIEPVYDGILIEKVDSKTKEEIQEDLVYMAELYFEQMTKDVLKYYLSYGDMYFKRILGLKEVDQVCKQGYEICKNRFNDVSVKLFKDRIEFLSKYNFSKKAFMSILKLPIKRYKVLKDKLVYSELVYLVIHAKDVIENNGFDVKLYNHIKEIFYVIQYLEKHNFELKNIDQFNSGLREYCARNNFESVFGTRAGLQKILKLERRQRQDDWLKENYYKVRFISDPKILLHGIEYEPADELEIRQHFETAYSNYLTQANKGGHLTAA